MPGTSLPAIRNPPGDPHTRAAAVAQAVLDDLYLPDYTPMKLQQKLSYAPRLAKWNELGILPGGAKSEVCAGMVKCSTNLNSDPQTCCFTVSSWAFPPAYTV